MKACDVAHKVIETVSGNTSCGIKIDAVKAFHDVCVIRNLEIGNNGLTEPLNLNVLGIVFSDGYRRIDDVRYRHHNGLYLLGILRLKCFELTYADGSSNLEEYGIMMKKGDEALVAKINELLQPIIDDGTVDKWILEHTDKAAEIE